MNRQEIIEKLTSICMEVFENDELELTDDMGVGSVDGWTSLTNMMLITEIEQTFGFKFKLRELPTLENIGSFITAIESHTQE